ncbi:amino acid ABC transporter permease [Paenibacillus antri]|nr:amino acid ABC transporter permease [Paenibacillus antri]
MGRDVSEAFLILLVIVLTFVITAGVLKRKARKKRDS